jgi:hypothetical protein
MISAYIDSPAFVDGVALSAVDLEILRNNAMLSNTLALRNVRAFQTAAQPALVNHWKNINPLRVFWGAFQFKVGMEEAHFEVRFTNPRAGTAQILFDDVVVFSTTVVEGAYDYTVDLTDFDWAQNQVIEVELRIQFNVMPTTVGGDYRILDAYCTPIVMSSSYPGVTTLGTLNATNLNKISNTADWLIQRLALVPYVPFQQLFWIQTRSKAPSSYPLWFGSISNENGNDRLIAQLDYNISNQSETIRIYVNGVLQHTSVPFTLGQKGSYGFDVDISGYTPSTRLDVYIDTNIITGNPASYRQPVMSRWSLKDVYTQPTHLVQPVPPTKIDINESISFSTLKSRINTIGSILTNTKARIDDYPRLFNRATMFRRRYVFKNSVNDDGHEGLDTGWTNVHFPRQQRIGNTLWVRGKDIKIVYGPVSIKGEPTKPWEYEWENEEELISGEKIETKMFYLDSFKGLYPGTVYYIIGQDLRFCSEYLFT